jgi:hypothetical protein
MGKHRKTDPQEPEGSPTVGDEAPVSGCKASGRQRGDDPDAGGPLAAGPQEGAGGALGGSEYSPERVSALMPLFNRLPLRATLQQYTTRVKGMLDHGQPFA